MMIPQTQQVGGTTPTALESTTGGGGQPMIPQVQCRAPRYQDCASPESAADRGGQMMIQHVGTPTPPGLVLPIGTTVRVGGPQGGDGRIMPYSEHLRDRGLPVSPVSGFAGGLTPQPGTPLTVTLGASFNLPPRPQMPVQRQPGRSPS